MPPAHTLALFWSRCLSDSVRGVSWDLTLSNLFLVIVRLAIANVVKFAKIAKIANVHPRGVNTSG